MGGKRFFLAKGRLKTIGVFLLLFSLLLFIFAPKFCKLQQMKEEERRLSERIERLKEENRTLALEEKRLQEDFYIEKLGREKMKMGRKGEVIYKIEGYEE